MKPPKIATERSGVFLKSVTELDDTAWLLTNRKFTHPLPPNKLGAPDYQVFERLRKIHKQTEPEIENFGIWDTESFQNIAFIGYVSLAPRQIETQIVGEVGSEIASTYRRRGYATISLRALIKYAREEKGFNTIVTEILRGNIPSQIMVQNMGFHPMKELPGRILYVQSPGLTET